MNETQRPMEQPNEQTDNAQEIVTKGLLRHHWTVLEDLRIKRARIISQQTFEIHSLDKAIQHEHNVITELVNKL